LKNEFVKNSSEQERGIFPSLPDTYFDLQSEQPTDGTNKSQKDPKLPKIEKKHPDPIVEKTNIGN